MMEDYAQSKSFLEDIIGQYGSLDEELRDVVNDMIREAVDREPRLRCGIVCALAMSGLPMIDRLRLMASAQGTEGVFRPPL